MSQKDHAVHNEQLCQLLFKDGNYNDWVITTAFYSALHYVHHEIFPFIDGAREYTSFDNYYNSIPKGQKKGSKHSVTIDLILAHDNEAGQIYKWLHDTCRTARYHKYKLPDALAKTAIDSLQELKTFLFK